MITLWDLLKPVADALRGRPPDNPTIQPLKPRKPTRVAPPTTLDRRVIPVEPPTHLANRVIAPPTSTSPTHPSILETITIPRRPPASRSAQKTSENPARHRTPTAKARPHADSMQDRYDAVVQQMLATYNVRVRKWRTSSSGVAWMVQYRDGKIQRLIESPKPKGPMSIAIFLHEIGHHAIGLGAFKPRCLEEYHAWKFSLDHMAKFDLNITDAVRTRMHKSLQYAVRKAVRRGLKSLPPELEPYA